MKKIYLLPNLITTANLVCGFLSMVHAFKGEFVRASWFIIIGAICDSLDGRVARMAKATSPFGVQYDSLSDLTSFGVAPGILLFAFALRDLSRFGVSVAAFYCICAALRLARFNVSAEEVNPEKLRKIRKGYFQGLPSPASAGLIVITVLMQSEFEFLPDEWVKYFMLALGLLLALLMVSNIPFPSFKELNWRARGKAWILLIPVVAILSVIQAPELTLFSIGYAYLVLSLGWAGYLCYIRDKNAAQPV
jgi:CDP-diacylglycerol--serine O-phosphatidyltransferase